MFSGTSIRPKEPDPNKGKISKKKKEDSSDSELEDGEVRSKMNTPCKLSSDKETNELTQTKPSNQEEEGEKDESVNNSVKENKINTEDNNVSEICPDENKENTGDEKAARENTNDSDKDITKVEEDMKELKTDTEGKDEKTINGKNGSIKVVEQAKLVNDVVEIEESDDYLMYLEEILEKIHSLFYGIHDGKQEGDRDMKQVIPAVRKEVLAGTKLVFSGLVPTNQSLEQSRAYNIARGLGAEVLPELRKGCTHLVAVRTGTAKVCLS